MSEPQRADRCWICGTERVRPRKARNLEGRLSPEDLRITDFHYGRTLALLTCADCGFVFANADELADLTALYEAVQDPEHEETQNDRALQMRWILSLARKARPGARTLLDIGAGTGLLVAEAESDGLDAIGIEPSRTFTEVARRHGRRVLQGVFPHPALTGRRFDVICLIDVIEHVADPLVLLRNCQRALTSEGALILVTPDVGSAVARLLRNRWWHFRVAHVGYFNRKSLCTALRLCGLKIEREYRAKWFFPVPYLAERLTRYLPFVGWINRAAPRGRLLNWLYSRIVTLNLRDSFLLIAKRTEPAEER